MIFNDLELQDIYNKVKYLLHNYKISDKVIVRAINKYNEIFSVLKDSLECDEEYNTRWNIFSYEDTCKSDFEFKYGIFMALIDLARNEKVLSTITPTRIIMNIDYSLQQLEDYLNKVKSYYIKSDWQKDYNKLHIKDLCSLYVKLQEGKRETIYSSKYVPEEEKNVIAKLDMIMKSLIDMRLTSNEELYCRYGMNIIISIMYNYFSLNNMFADHYQEIINCLNTFHNDLEQIYEKFKMNFIVNYEDVLSFFISYYNETKDNKPVKVIK